MLPARCEGLEDETEEFAQQTLNLVDKLEYAKIESYIAHQKQLFFENETFMGNRSRAEMEAIWACRFYCKHVRDYVAIDSLEKGIFAHRIFQNTFLAMIPPRTIVDPEKKQKRHFR